MDARSSQRTPHGAPRVAEIAATPKARSGGFRLHRESAAAFVLSVAATFLAFQMLRQQGEDEARALFERRAANVATSVRSQLERPLKVLESVCSPFAATPDVRRTEFGHFVRKALACHPGIRAARCRAYVEARAQKMHGANEASHSRRKGRTFTCTRRPTR
jgi:CHASE1-domain containing sensor protein